MLPAHSQSNGQYVLDPDGRRRGPYGDPVDAARVARVAVPPLERPVRHLPRRVEPGVQPRRRRRLRGGPARRARRLGRLDEDLPARAHVQRVEGERLPGRRLPAGVRRHEARRHRRRLRRLPLRRRQRQGLQRPGRAGPQQPGLPRHDGRQRLDAARPQDDVAGRGRRERARGVPRCAPSRCCSAPRRSTWSWNRPATACARWSR